MLFSSGSLDWLNYFDDERGLWWTQNCLLVLWVSYLKYRWECRQYLVADTYTADTVN